MRDMTSLGPALGAGARALVTGGAGFVGSHLVEELVGRGVDVTVVDNLSSGRLRNLDAVLAHVHVVQSELSDVLEAGTLDLSSFGWVFHLAANAYIPPSVSDPAFDFGVNLRSSFELLEKLRLQDRRPRLVYASTAGVYGDPVRLPIKETDPTVPISPYGVSKLATERYVDVYSRLYGIAASSVRFFSIYGPRQRKQVVYDLFRKLEQGTGRLEVYGDGSQKRDFVYVTDAVQALLLAATAAPGQGEVYNVASGYSCSIGELAVTICRVAGSGARVCFTGSTRPGDAQEWVVDLSRLKELGYAPGVSLEQGLRRVYEWLTTFEEG